MRRPHPGCRCRRARWRCRRTPTSTSWAPAQAANIDTHVLEWIAGQMRGKRRSNHTLAAMVATLVGAATLPLVQLPNVLDIGLM